MKKTKADSLFKKKHDHPNYHQSSNSIPFWLELPFINPRSSLVKKKKLSKLQISTCIRRRIGWKRKSTQRHLNQIHGQISTVVHQHDLINSHFFANDSKANETQLNTPIPTETPIDFNHAGEHQNPSHHVNPLPSSTCTHLCHIDSAYDRDQRTLNIFRSIYHLQHLSLQNSTLQSYLSLLLQLFQSHLINRHLFVQACANPPHSLVNLKLLVLLHQQGILRIAEYLQALSNNFSFQPNHPFSKDGHHHSSSIIHLGANFSDELQPGIPSSSIFHDGQTLKRLAESIFEYHRRNEPCVDIFFTNLILVASQPLDFSENNQHLPLQMIDHFCDKSDILIEPAPSLYQRMLKLMIHTFPYPSPIGQRMIREKIKKLFEIQENSRLTSAQQISFLRSKIVQDKLATSLPTSIVSEKAALSQFLTFLVQSCPYEWILEEFERAANGDQWIKMDLVFSVNVLQCLQCEHSDYFQKTTIMDLLHRIEIVSLNKADLSQLVIVYLLAQAILNYPSATPTEYHKPNQGHFSFLDQELDPSVFPRNKACQSQCHYTQFLLTSLSSTTQQDKLIVVDALCKILAFQSKDEIIQQGADLQMMINETPELKRYYHQASLQIRKLSTIDNHLSNHTQSSLADISSQVNDPLESFISPEIHLKVEKWIYEYKSTGKSPGFEELNVMNIFQPSQLQETFEVLLLKSTYSKVNSPKYQLVEKLASWMPTRLYQNWLSRRDQRDIKDSNINNPLPSSICSSHSQPSDFNLDKLQELSRTWLEWINNTLESLKWQRDIHHSPRLTIEELTQSLGQEIKYLLNSLQSNDAQSSSSSPTMVSSIYSIVYNVFKEAVFTASHRPLHQEFVHWMECLITSTCVAHHDLMYPVLLEEFRRIIVNSTMSNLFSVTDYLCISIVIVTIASHDKPSDQRWILDVVQGGANSTGIFDLTHSLGITQAASLLNYALDYILHAYNKIEISYSIDIDKNQPKCHTSGIKNTAHGDTMKYLHHQWDVSSEQDVMVGTSTRAGKSAHVNISSAVGQHSNSLRRGYFPVLMMKLIVWIQSKLEWLPSCHTTKSPAYLVRQKFRSLTNFPSLKALLQRKPLCHYTLTEFLSREKAIGLNHDIIPAKLRIQWLVHQITQYYLRHEFKNQLPHLCELLLDHLLEWMMIEYPEQAAKTNKRRNAYDHASPSIPLKPIDIHHRRSTFSPFFINRVDYDTTCMYNPFVSEWLEHTILMLLQQLTLQLSSIYGLTLSLASNKQDDHGDHRPLPLASPSIPHHHSPMGSETFFHGEKYGDDVSANTIDEENQPRYLDISAKQGPIWLFDWFNKLINQKFPHVTNETNKKQVISNVIDLIHYLPNRLLVLENGSASMTPLGLNGIVQFFRMNWLAFCSTFSSHGLIDHLFAAILSQLLQELPNSNGLVHDHHLNMIRNHLIISFPFLHATWAMMWPNLRTLVALSAKRCRTIDWTLITAPIETCFSFSNLVLGDPFPSPVLTNQSNFNLKSATQFMPNGLGHLQHCQLQDKQDRCIKDHSNQYDDQLAFDAIGTWPITCAYLIFCPLKQVATTYIECNMLKKLAEFLSNSRQSSSIRLKVEGSMTVLMHMALNHLSSHAMSHKLTLGDYFQSRPSLCSLCATIIEWMPKVLLGIALIVVNQENQYHLSCHLDLGLALNNDHHGSFSFDQSSLLIQNLQEYLTLPMPKPRTRSFMMLDEKSEKSDEHLPIPYHTIRSGPFLDTLQGLDIHRDNNERNDLLRLATFLFEAIRVCNTNNLVQSLIQPPLDTFEIKYWIYKFVEIYIAILNRHPMCLGVHEMSSEWMNQVTNQVHQLIISLHNYIEFNMDVPMPMLVQLSTIDPKLSHLFGHIKNHNKH